MITVISQIQTSKGCGGGGGRLATLAALCLSTSRACLRASVRLGGQKQNKPQKRRKMENYSSNVAEQCKIKGKPKSRFLSTCTESQAIGMGKHIKKTTELRLEGSIKNYLLQVIQKC